MHRTAKCPKMSMWKNEKVIHIKKLEFLGKISYTPSYPHYPHVDKWKKCRKKVSSSNICFGASDKNGFLKRKKRK